MTPAFLTVFIAIFQFLNLKSIAKSLLNCIAKVGLHIYIAIHQKSTFAETSNHSIGMAGFFFGVPGDEYYFGIEYVVKLKQYFMV